MYSSEQLIALLVDIDETVGNSSTISIQDTFQLKKIKFIWISQAFIGLIVIQTNSVDAYGSKFCLPRNYYSFKDLEKIYRNYLHTIFDI